MVVEEARVAVEQLLVLKYSVASQVPAPTGLKNLQMTRGSRLSDWLPISRKRSIISLVKSFIGLTLIIY